MLVFNLVCCLWLSCRDLETQLVDPKGDGKAHSPARKLRILLQSSTPWELCCKNADTYPISQQTFWMTQIPNPIPFPLPSGTKGFFFFFFFLQIGASALKTHTSQKKSCKMQNYILFLFSLCEQASYTQMC